MRRSREDVDGILREESEVATGDYPDLGLVIVLAARAVVLAIRDLEQTLVERT
jgi:hypothetical protein